MPPFTGDDPRSIPSACKVDLRKILRSTNPKSRGNTTNFSPATRKETSHGFLRAAISLFHGVTSASPRFGRQGIPALFQTDGYVREEVNPYRNLNSLRRRDSICTLFSVRAYRWVNLLSPFSDTSIMEMMFTSCR
jgi:hypothetical protein